MWFVYLSFGQHALNYGIIPRHTEGLKGIIFSPFIHANFGHIAANSLPFLILTWVMALFYRRIWLLAFALIVITGGLGVWLFGRSAVHIGASLAIFGVFGFLVASGFFRKQFKAVIIAIVIGVLYGGILVGILPTNPYISWEGHLFGFLAGIFWAYLFKNVKEEKEEHVLPNKNL
jgi:membrane associated rhomboid family serine protease